MWEKLVWEEEIRQAGQKLKPDIESEVTRIYWIWRHLVAESRDGEKLNEDLGVDSWVWLRKEQTTECWWVGESGRGKV